MNKLAITAIAALALAGAAAVPAVAVMPLPPLTHARLGETVTVGHYRVTPIAVLEDSRCPARVACVWSGQVRLSVRIAAIRGGEGYRGEMTSMRPLQLRHGALRLVTIEPPNTTNGRPRPMQYRFGFQFQPRADQDTKLS
jgi:hypothetical protein